MRTRVVVPDDYANVLLSMAYEQGCIKLLMNGPEYSPEFQLSCIQKPSKEWQQIIYQLMYLYDELIVTDYEYELFDVHELEDFGIRCLDYDKQAKLSREVKDDGTIEVIDVNFAESLKQGVIRNVIKGIGAFNYTKNLSDYYYASELYDMYFKIVNGMNINPGWLEQEYNENARLYYEKSIEKSIDRFVAYGSDDGATEAYIKFLMEHKSSVYADIIINAIRGPVDDVLRDFRILEDESVTILNPNYDIDRLGIKDERADMGEATKIYGTLKLFCRKLFDNLPEFESFEDVSKMKDKNSKGIKSLRKEIDCLSRELTKGGEEEMILHAKNRVERAAREIQESERLSRPLANINFYTSIAGNAVSHIQEMSSPLLSSAFDFAAAFAVSMHFGQKIIDKKYGWVKCLR